MIGKVNIPQTVIYINSFSSLSISKHFYFINDRWKHYHIF